MVDINPGPVVNQFIASSGDEHDSPKQLIVRVQFDPFALPSRVWVVEGLKYPTLPDDPDAYPACRLRGTYAEASFTDTVPGLLYAVCWEWETEGAPASRA